MSLPAQRFEQSLCQPTAVIIRLDRSRPVKDVVIDLVAAGLQVDRVLAGVSVVCGTAEQGALHRLLVVPGVAAVEADHPVQAAAGPPGVDRSGGRGGSDRPLPAGR
jgi:hypothetical protein